MGTFIDLVSVLLIFLCITAIFSPNILHTTLVYFFRCNIPEEKELLPYYTVTGIIAGLTSVYITRVQNKN